MGQGLEFYGVQYNELSCARLSEEKDGMREAFFSQAQGGPTIGDILNDCIAHCQETDYGRCC
jgi:hypothetical protein